MHTKHKEKLPIKFNCEECEEWEECEQCEQCKECEQSSGIIWINPGWLEQPKTMVDIYREKKVPGEKCTGKNYCNLNR